MAQEIGLVRAICWGDPFFLLSLRGISLESHLLARLGALVPWSLLLWQCFKDHWAFLDIDDEESLTRELMFDDIFLDNVSEVEEQNTPLEDRKVNIPLLMLMGILYCRSNRAQRAEKFYELVEIQLTDQLEVND